jgi:hypothetical protein
MSLTTAVSVTSVTNSGRTTNATRGSKQEALLEFWTIGAVKMISR